MAPRLDLRDGRPGAEGNDELGLADGPSAMVTLEISADTDGTAGRDVSVVSASNGRSPPAPGVPLTAAA
jgi:hypothetical protein